MMLKTVVSIITCVGSLATALSLIFLIIQTIANKKSIELLQKTYDYTSDWQCKEKAVELARYYKDYILNDILYINSVLKETGALSLLENIKNGDIDMFTNDELVSLVGEQIVKKIEEKIAALSNLEALVSLRQEYNEITNREPGICEAMMAKWREYTANKGSSSDNISQTLAICLCQDFGRIISDTLNNLEYFSMNFTTEVADENVVFQSLHQTYLKGVRALYFAIASQNSNPKDKFYTNIIKLYHIWAKRDIENSRRANSTVQPVSAVRK